MLSFFAITVALFFYCVPPTAAQCPQISSCIGLHPKDFGSMTTPTETRQTLQKTLNAAAHGGTVCLPAGTLTIDGPLNVIGEAVIVQGAGIAATIISTPVISWPNFGYQYAIQMVGLNNTVRDLRIDGHGRENPVWVPNQAGGLSVGNGSYVRCVHVNDTNYFGFWAAGMRNARIHQSINSGGKGNDQIGGGQMDGFEVGYHHWMPGLIGNSYDHVDGVNAWLHDNFDQTGTPKQGNFWSEGVHDSVIERNYIVGGRSITAESDGGYLVPRPVNAKNVTIRDNLLVGGSITTNFRSNGSSVWVGGGVQIINNTLIKAGQESWDTMGGILWLTETAQISTGGGVVAHNRVILPRSGSMGSIPIGGINIETGFHTMVFNNTILFSPGQPSLGLVLGGGGIPSVAVSVHDNLCCEAAVSAFPGSLPLRIPNGLCPVNPDGSCATMPLPQVWQCQKVLSPCTKQV